ncbi:MAG: glycyl-radical enzyme activating protein [Candidatus Hermodarchaeota archaeon]
MKVNDNIGLIFNIQRFSIHDGPGVRTTVFFKGCPLRCQWCHNPESINPFPEIMYNKSKCIQCYKCLDICPVDALSQTQNGIAIDRGKCDGCGKCAEECYSGALELCGKHMKIEEVMTEVNRDILFYKNSNGGVTASGGEALAQPNFVANFFRKCREAGIHTVLDTSGYAKWEIYKKVLNYTDLVLYDIKTMDPERHKRLIGVSNDLILANLARTNEEGIPTIIRIPLVLNYNIVNVKEDIKEISDFIQELSLVKRVDLLPFHHLGKSKTLMLGQKYTMDIETPDKEYVEKIREVLTSNGIKVSIGGLF